MANKPITRKKDIRPHGEVFDELEYYVCSDYWLDLDKKNKENAELEDKMHVFLLSLLGLGLNEDMYGDGVSVREAVPREAKREFGDCAVVNFPDSRSIRLIVDDVMAEISL